MGSTTQRPSNSIYSSRFLNLRSVVLAAHELTSFVLTVTERFSTHSAHERPMLLIRLTRPEYLGPFIVNRVTVSFRRHYVPTLDSSSSSSSGQFTTDML